MASFKTEYINSPLASTTLHQVEAQGFFQTADKLTVYRKLMPCDMDTWIVLDLNNLQSKVLSSNTLVIPVEVNHISCKVELACRT